MRLLKIVSRLAVVSVIKHLSGSTFIKEIFFPQNSEVATAV